MVYNSSVQKLVVDEGALGCLVAGARQMRQPRNLSTNSVDSALGRSDRRCSDALDYGTYLPLRLSRGEQQAQTRSRMPG